MLRASPEDAAQARSEPGALEKRFVLGGGLGAVVFERGSAAGRFIGEAPRPHLAVGGADA